jgi:hypothetical protein
VFSGGSLVSNPVYINLHIPSDVLRHLMITFLACHSVELPRFVRMDFCSRDVGLQGQKDWCESVEGRREGKNYLRVN